MSNPNDLSYLVSSVDLKAKIKHKFRLIQYKDIFKYDNLFKLLPTKLSILVILINTSPNGSGHWTVLIRQNNLLIYFDSYGKGIDEELKYVSKADRTTLHETKPYLSMLVKNSNLNLTYNNKQYQSYSDDVNTCGKYTVFVCNCILKGLDLKEIQNLLKETKSQTKQSYDTIVNYFYNYKF